MVKSFDGPTREQVIKWSRDAGAGFSCETLLADGRDADDLLSRLAAIAYAAGQAAEREECAKVAESAEIPIDIDVWMGTKKALTAATAIGISVAIRARGNNGK